MRTGSCETVDLDAGGAVDDAGVAVDDIGVAVDDGLSR